MCPPFPALPPGIRADYKMKVKNLFFTTLGPVWSLRNSKQGRRVELSEGLNSDGHSATHLLSDLGAVMGQGSPEHQFTHLSNDQIVLEFAGHMQTCSDFRAKVSEISLCLAAPWTESTEGLLFGWWADFAAVVVTYALTLYAKFLVSYKSDGHLSTQGKQSNSMRRQ